MYKIDKIQIIGEAKERNKFYKALIKIQKITDGTTGSALCMLEAIEKICKRH